MRFEIIDKLDDDQIGQLMELYSREWWTKDRKVDDVRQMLRECDLLIACCEPDSRKLIGFTRILTDYVYKALVLDVIVAPSYRGTGLGRALLDTVVGHPQLRDVRHFDLYCRPDLVAFYKRWGFEEQPLGELRFMRLTRSDAS
jgi:ribosomal protein S18 acetylase RimI-like enzyme